MYKRDANYLEKYHREAKKVVILPQTINGNEQLLASLDSNVDILCRELTSFEYVKSVVTKANVFLMDDMAFSIDVDKTLAAKSLYSNTEYFFSRLPKQRFYLLLNYLKRAKNGSLKTKVLNSFRKDIESTSIEIPEDNIDVSYIFAFYDFSEGAVQEVVQRMLRFLNNFEIVNTNRLHICIASALLGKK
ncbi:MAG: hypothetical protein HC839_01450 [Leptolyngbyaceae cyanobacterium RM2_2_21]|nr:hypothetical protein [Leptolyngbyaceae cyanobacterium RM2_2_21]